ncbi:MAG TPA: tRNA lysidine(34) synthetase TilS [Myxococcales bacterium]|nr:tRNA lysidine(34) synthetase TilS [Myxococcales bacterium]
MGTLADTVEQAVASGLPRDARVLVACSGGADSSALAAASERLGLRCVIGHVDHGLRPDSASDADRVRDLARRLGVPFLTLRIQFLNIRELGLEAAAREARYAALGQLAVQASAPVVATAHTRRDQAETLLLRLFRGAGPGALSGIRRTRPLLKGVELVRPLLDVTRAATEAYCAARGIHPLDDPHNLDPARARAQLRALWPALVALNPRLEEALCAAAATFAEEDALLTGLAASGAHLHPALQRRALLAQAADAGLRPERPHIEALLRLLEQGGSVDLPGGRARVTFERRGARPVEEAGAAVAVPGPGDYAWGRRALHVAPGDAEGTRVDLTEAPFPWTLRGQRPGDRFRPAGGRSKKVSDLWIDAHIPREERTRLAVLTDCKGRLFWVEGLRPGAACRSPAGATFCIGPEMKPPDGPLACRRRPESHSATMVEGPDEEPR